MRAFQGVEILLGYAIAAYAIAIGSVVAYGVWVQAQRRALIRQQARDGAPAGPAGGAGAGPPELRS